MIYIFTLDSVLLTSVNLELYSQLIECVGLPGEHRSLLLAASQWDIINVRVSEAGKVSSEKRIIFPFASFQGTVDRLGKKSTLNLSGLCVSLFFRQSS